MPIYEYRCTNCASSFEARRSMSDSHAAILCPAGHSTVTKLFSTFAATGIAEASPATACGSPVPGGCGGGCACCA